MTRRKNRKTKRRTQKQTKRGKRIDQTGDQRETEKDGTKCNKPKAKDKHGTTRQTLKKTRRLRLSLL